MISSMEQLNRHPLPEDIIQDILIRLPVESLINFRCVCKSWRSLISSSQFIKHHLIRSSSSSLYANHKAIIRSIDSSTNTFRYFAYSFNSILYDPISPMNAVKQIDFPITDSINSVCLFMIGSCNGLFCVSPLPDSYTIFNPSLKKLHKLPSSDISHAYNSTHGFGYDKVNNDYKVIRISAVCGPRKNYLYNETEIYSLKKNSWRNIQKQPIGHFLSPVCGVLVSGKLHWSTYGRTNTFLSFDMVTEEFGKVARPKNRYDELVDWYLVESHGLLYAFADDETKNGMDVWVMNEYGVDKSWSKLGTIPYFSGVKRLRPLFVTWNGIVILKNSVCTVLYNLKYSKFEDYKVYNNDNIIHTNRHVDISLPPFIETLVPPYFHE